MININCLVQTFLEEQKSGGSNGVPRLGIRFETTKQIELTGGTG